MPKSPLGNLPLKDSPYYSRITSEYGTEDKNYYLLAFNPGYSLQASELNEIQELFFLNQNLTQRMNQLWSKAGYAKIPFWEGLIPLDPTTLSVTTPTVQASSTSTKVTISAGWFLWTDTTSKLSFWIYQPNTYTSITKSTDVGDTVGYIGFDVSKSAIICCPSSSCDPEVGDENLRDNSSGSTTSEFTCGASRLKATFGSEVVIRNAIADDFYPIFKITVSADGASAAITFYDGQSLITTG